MNLMNGIMRPGEVLQVLDLGEIKCSAPGLFSELDDPELLPPIRPWFGFHSSSFSKPHEGDLIWVVNFVNNPQELFWVRRFNTDKDLSEFMDEDESIEIVCHIPSGMSYASLYFKDGSGWIMKNDSSIINIDKEGDIILSKDAGSRCISITDEGISLGTKDEGQPAVLGDNLVDVLRDMCNLIEQIGIQAKANPYTLALSMPIETMLPAIEEQLQGITSMHIKLD